MYFLHLDTLSLPKFSGNSLGLKMFGTLRGLTVCLGVKKVLTRRDGKPVVSMTGKIRETSTK